MEGGAIGNAWHASQVTYTRDKEGRQENQKAEAAESKKKAKKDWLGLKTGWGLKDGGVSFLVA